MRRIYVSIMICLCGMFSNSQAQICIRGIDSDNYSLHTKDSIYSLGLKDQKEINIILDEKVEPGYASLFQGEKRYPLYIDRSKDLVIELKGNVICFTGALAPVNQYLNRQHLNLRTINWNLPEEKFIEQLNACCEKLKMSLESLNLDPCFVEKEKIRLKYLVALNMITYPRMYRAQTKNFAYEPGKAYFDFMQSFIKDEDSILDAVEYQNVLNSFISILVQKENGGIHDAYVELRKELDYAFVHLKNPRVKAWFVNEQVCTFLKYNGVGKFDELLPIYNEWVSSSSMRKELEKICSYWNGLFRGEKVPDFVWKDIEGKEWRLSDFRKKIVYIDVWASWCIPCCEQLPYWKTLKKQFAKDNIVFISLSSDKNENAWKTKVSQEKMDGLLLNIAGDRSFMNFFKIKTIPRFILLDQEGRIIDAVMTQPSNPETEKMLRKVLNEMK